jgi:tRNA A-37 threonylcarbamoyl transferase component Bud32
MSRAHESRVFTIDEITVEVQNQLRSKYPSLYRLEILERFRDMTVSCRLFNKYDREFKRVIIKQPQSYNGKSYDRDAEDRYSIAYRLRKEIATLKIFSSMTEKPCPELIAYNLEYGYVVTEYLEGSLLKDIIWEDKSIRKFHGIREYTRSLAKFHAGVYGDKGNIFSIFTQFKIDPDFTQVTEIDAFLVLLQKRLSSIGFDFKDVARKKLSILFTEFYSFDPGFSLIHGDICLDNVIIQPNGKAVLIDLNTVEYNPIFLDIVYLVQYFPSCAYVRRLDDILIDELLELYWNELPESMQDRISKDKFNQMVFIASLIWLAKNLITHLMPNSDFFLSIIEGDKLWGDSSILSRLLTRIEHIETYFAHFCQEYKLVSFLIDLRSHIKDTIVVDEIAPISNF